MRFVYRDKIVPPLVLTARNGLGARERRRVHAHYAGDNPESFDFRMYKHDEVKAALTTLFHGKCAYCEWYYAPGASMEVEHYRPKLGIKEDPTHSGYWWHGATWHNLLPVCSHCNTWKNQVVCTTNPDGSVTVADGHSGKGTAFPIAGIRAVSRVCNHEREDPLLIDPTRRDPTMHLRFTQLPSQTGLLSVVVAADGPVPDIHGRTTIDVMGLNRRVLVEARNAKLLEIAARVRMLRKLIAMALRAAPDIPPEDVQSIRDEIIALLRCGEANQQFATAAASYVQEELGKMRGELAVLYG